MHDLLSTFQARFAEWLIALGQHVQLSLLSLLIAILIAVPLAIILSSRKRIAGVVLNIA